EAQQTTDYKITDGQTIAKIYVTQGQTVAAGDVLFEYDVTEAKNNVQLANLDIEGLNQQIAALSPNASDPYTKIEIIQLQTQIEAKRMEIQGYQQQISQSVVKSSVSGIVKAVNESGYNSQGMEAPIVSVMESGEYRVKCKINEQQFYLINVGDPVIVRSRVDETKTWKGTVSKIETEPTTSDNNDMYYYGGGGGDTASQYPFYVALESTDGLMLGQHVIVEPMNGDEPAAEGLWVDQSLFVMDDNGSCYVWVAEKGKLVKRKVEIGMTNDENYTYQVLSGLELSDLVAWPDDTYKEGMKVIDSSSMSVFDGAEVG
ncbi:MAG: HlyD family efflux transporter periplasmic adaptor subunit, partial [Firmicutes bacterium]|nr:HlyD family efflux transporter periplasmic adaptor subunit [Bacillota bacterium]